jgi:1,4-dihydroxy-2-naphthoate polyprenyltransferase
MVMSFVKLWFRAARPRTLILSISPVLIGTCVAVRDVFFTPWIFIFTLLASMAIQVGTNLANDYFDFLKGSDSSERIGPPRLIPQGLVSPQAIKTAFIAVFFCAALLSLPLILRGGILIAVIAVLSILLGILYTAGSYSLAHLGLSELCVFLFFGPIATAGTAYLQGGIFSIESTFIGIATGALPCCVLIINNLRDIRQDQLAGRKTLIVRFGRRFGETIFIFFLILALLTPFYYWEYRKPLCWIISLLAIPAFLMTISLLRIRDPREYNPFFKKMGLFATAYTLLFCLGWLL